MSAFYYYLVPALLAAVAAEEQSQWTPYTQAQQWGQQAQQWSQQPQQWDQQIQPSQYSAGYDFSSNEKSYQLGEHQDFSKSLEDHGQGIQGIQSLDHGSQDFSQHEAPQHSFQSTHHHVEEENPEPIKHYKEIVVPFSKNYEFKVNQPVLIPVPHPIPIQVPVPKAVVIPIIKEVSIPVEKSVPYPVEKIVHVPHFKKVPFHVVKHIFVGVEKPIPFKVPVHETIIHTKKGSHKL